MTLGKRTKAVREGIDRDKSYPIAEAVKMVKERAKAKFDETIEVAMNLGVDPRHADQMVRGVAARCASACLRAAARRTRRRPRVPTSSAPRTWSRRSTKARSTSIAVSPHQT